MILVDSSVWIDYFRGEPSIQCERLDQLLEGAEATLVVADLILLEVLQGFRSDNDYHRAFAVLDRIPCLSLGGKQVTIRAAANYRLLRRRGVTIRKSIDVLIGTFCIEQGIEILHNDRDFDPMVKHLGLRTA